LCISSGLWSEKGWQASLPSANLIDAIRAELSCMMLIDSQMIENSAVIIYSFFTQAASHVLTVNVWMARMGYL
jgi:hypothetical protein